MATAVPINVKYAAYGVISSESGAGIPIYAGIKEFEPVMKVKYDPKTSSTTLNGSGVPRRSAVKTGSDDIETELNQINFKQYSDLFGHPYTAASGSGEKAVNEQLDSTLNDKIPYIGFGWCLENDDGSLTAFWYYKGRFEEPGQDVTQIDNDKITYSTPTMKGSFVFAGNGFKRSVVNIPTDTGSVDYKKLFKLTTEGA